MIRIAVVGDIGSGKSFVARQFGYPVFDADLEVRKLYKKSKKCYYKIKKILPDYISSFPIKKTELTKAILKNKKNLKKINKIIHPEIRLKMKKFLRKNKNFFFVVLDIPLLIENKINKKGDILVYVSANRKLISKKLKKRPNFNSKILKKLRKSQFSVDKKISKCDFIIRNNFKHDTTRKHVKRVLQKIKLNARSNTRY